MSNLPCVSLHRAWRWRESNSTIFLYALFLSKKLLLKEKNLLL